MGNGMPSRVDKVVIGICIAVVALLAALPIYVEAPMFARCTQAAVDILDHADPLDRRPPSWVVSAVEYDVTNADLPLGAARMSMWNSNCNGPRHRTVLRLFE